MNTQPKGDTTNPGGGAGHALKTAVDSLRQQLIDIGKRNRLTNAPVGKDRAKQLDIEDERSDEVFKTLYVRGKKMTFEPLRGAVQAEQDELDPEQVYLPREDEPPAGELAPHHVDSKMQTRLTAERLQKRLLTLYRDAQALEEEQGISVLFLGIGFLRWYESESSELERFAPLILLPVDLERDSARGRFTLSFRDQDLEPNLSLRAMLAADFDLDLPGFPAGTEWVPSQYFRSVSAAMSSQTRWRVQPNTLELSFYSFAKFLMWNDLAPSDEWTKGSAGNGLLEGLLVGGFDSGPSIFAPAENLDKRFPDPKDLCHILDADSSQTQIIAAARAGRNLVVQGPPGTGKSQTIANIIAAIARDGKRVLFVAEKRAALDVVHDRLEKCGLGPLCLELHSHKANRKQIYAELKRTLDLGEPNAVNDMHYERVRRVRDELNATSALLHKLDEVTEETPYGVIGRIAELGEGDCPRPDFRIPGSDAWSAEAFDERIDAASALAALTAEHGSEQTHIWRGARKRLTQLDRRALADTLQTALERLDAGREVYRTSAAAASISDAASVQAASEVAAHLDALGEMPQAVPDLLAAETTVAHPDAVQELFEQVAALQTLRASLLSEMIEGALELRWDEVRLEIAGRGKSLFRWLSSPYRNAVARLRSVQRSELPKGLGDRLEILDRLLEHRSLCRSIGKNGHIGRDVLGIAWRDEDTDIEQALPAVRWIASQARRLGTGEAVVRQLGAILPDLDLLELGSELRRVYAAWLEAWQQVAAATDLDIHGAFGSESVDSVELEQLGTRLRSWLADMGSVEGWHRLSAAGRHVSELGLDELRTRLANGRLAPERTRETLEFVRAEAIWERLRKVEPGLERIDGPDRTAKVEQFKQLDQQLQELASQEVALKHFSSLPSGSAGQVGIVRGEANKKVRHLRLRKLLDKAGEAVATIKPVFLMSPLSVAQYLKPGGLTFDLLLIDEASQVRPADAMGAILRSRQIIVVGDQKQMPPTSFFDRQIGGGEDEVDAEDVGEIQAAQVGDMESILSLCDARAMAGGMLRWHYRSKHPSLIQVSNHEFYDSGLICPPSPDSAGKSTGLTYAHVEGVYERGRKRNNPIEAEFVVEQVLAHARKHPAETLGVVALSVAQRDTIRDKLEFKRAEFPELEAFCKEGKDGAFFVKNLENVQGDERDVIFISIGYGKDSGGYMSQSFGPVSSDGGERRLNVLFTRAKKRCRVFSSIRHTDIRLDATKHAGPRVLKRFLKFAETGELDIPVITGDEMDSPFEEAVAKALHSHGYRVEAQVGSSGFRIDLAVYDPDDEGRFLLAIECDGAPYHSSSWARERDRLRQIVLEQKGWTFHRIWSTDWFYNRDVEMHKLLEAIDRARSNRDWDAAPAAPPQRGPVDRGQPALPAETRAVEYAEAEFSVPDRAFRELHESPPGALEKYVVQIVEMEGPVHIDEIGRRLSRRWGYRRAGQRIQALVANAARNAVQARRIRYDSELSTEFLARPDHPTTPVIRDRRNASASIRSVPMLPPTEVQAAILLAVERNIAIDLPGCAVEVARMFGYRATSSDLRNLVAQHAKILVRGGQLAMVASELRLA